MIRKSSRNNNQPSRSKYCTQYRMMANTEVIMMMSNTKVMMTMANTEVVMMIVRAESWMMMMVMKKE